MVNFGIMKVQILSIPEQHSFKFGGFIPKAREGFEMDPYEPWTGDRYENKKNASRLSKDQIEYMASALGYTGPKTNKGLQKWIMSDPEMRKVADDFHRMYGMPKAGKPDDDIWGYRWDAILENIYNRKFLKPLNTQSSASVPSLSPRPVPGMEIPVDSPKQPDGPIPGDSSFRRRGDSFGYTTPDVASMMHAAAQMGNIKRYYPWMAPVKLTAPRATYYDPSRELAANAELAHMQTMGAAMTGDPQKSRGMASMIQGQAAGNVANILGRYNNLNVGVANQNEAARTEIANNQAMMDAQRANELYKGTVTTDQQYDNAMRAASDNMLKSYINAWNNRSKLSQLNATNKYFNIDPVSGKIYQVAGKSLSDAGSDEETLEQYAQRLKKQGVDPAVINTLVRARLQRETNYANSKGMSSTSQTRFSFGDED